MADFIVPMVNHNVDGWGPCGDVGSFSEASFQPFSKSDRLGKISDWTGNIYQDRRNQNKYASQFGSANQYTFYNQDDENYRLVDSSKPQKVFFKRKIYPNKKAMDNKKSAPQQLYNSTMSKSQKNWERDKQRQYRKWQKLWGRMIEQKNRPQNVKSREASVRIRDNWEVTHTIDFSALAKLNLSTVPPLEDLVKCGSMDFYDKQYERVTCKSEKRLIRIDKVFHRVTTTQDPIIRQLAKSKSGNVFATDLLVATLMCCTRSVYPWDIVVQKLGDSLFFDMRDESDLDALTVSETATDPPLEESGVNSPKNLSEEATYINHNFSQQVLRQGEEKYHFEQKNPFLEEGDDPKSLASVGYRYRKASLGNNIEVIIRCEHNAVTHGPNGEIQFLSIKALNEWDHKFSGGVDWRTKLDNQKGAVWATELKNNSSKLAKWTVMALLASSDHLKLGYVSRASIKDSAHHVILGTHQFKPTEFANQINLKMDNGWGILRCLIDNLKELPDGKYVIMKDPNKHIVRIYHVPDHAFSDDDEDDDDSDIDDEENSDDEEVNFLNTGMTKTANIN